MWQTNLNPSLKVHDQCQAPIPHSEAMWFRVEATLPEVKAQLWFMLAVYLRTSVPHLQNGDTHESAAG